MFAATAVGILRLDWEDMAVGVFAPMALAF